MSTTEQAAAPSRYGQFCPMAKAMEVLDERWTLLVVRELLLGSAHFNDLRRGVPKMSPALLSKRLKSLTRAGVVARREVGGRTTYSLTQCGRELAPVVEALGAWGIRWIGDLGDDDLDPHLLMWDMRRTVPVEAWPRNRTVVHFRLSGVAARATTWWLVVADGHADVCDIDPGYDITASVESSLRTLTAIWRGDLNWAGCLLDGSVTITGPAAARRRVPDWIGQSTSAAIPRPLTTRSTEPPDDGGTGAAPCSDPRR
ncbi:winged helix-turn-helix transcriptional regulator [Mycolicibacterium palauense]|uniref:winged helix-turn-helix transcriptional regulator n=1 Tax=Mycolicibacterium palauense TaxID=2034511 RepID=UPI001C3F3D47|nr:helix-turn-helix domain-containing protein [Mycolicibacterium palauense]